MTMTMPARSADPPSPQEVSRKLSLHSVAKPKKSNVSISGTESDSESVFVPEYISPPSASASLTGGVLAGSSTQPALGAIAERRSASGEESDDDDDDDDDGWPVADKKGKHQGSTDESVIKAGYLRKKGERRKTWKKRWFVLRPGHLAYYKTSAEYELLRLLDLIDVHACTPVALKKHPYAFGLVSPTRTYYLQASSQDDMQGWVKAISDARELLMQTTAKNSGTSAPIPIPTGGTSDAHYPPPLTPSPPTQSLHMHALTSSESEDASSNAPRSFPTSSPTRATFASPNKSLTAPVDASKPVASGYLMKCGSKRRNWRKRWFVLTGEQLVYSGSHMDTKPHRQIALSQILDALEYDLPQQRAGPTHVSPPGVTSPPTTVPVNSEEGDAVQKKHTFKIVTTKRTLLLCAPSEEEEIKWLSAVRALIARRSGAGVVPGSAGASSVAKPTGTEIQHAASGSGSGPSGIRGIARRLSVSAGSGGIVGNAVPEEGAPDRA
ncbi:PH-domain-containing protein [Gloeophyllum trabeum ATCC 11539]|uniref:PH-domain-containing protein n=1 Tax=Gloeophyllum trabeum (strain ATCC 11539 / FP-39264 / Madison 617) TaxID=670483 RepID=S7Q2V1_GLOTA|nr:PH-domain-containing protein [Gloeophyllum trabeum ATCC 11539]EPQ54326.1 PH-domain-containing protein [Gloeophyllum trabeum ATCC 11539]